MGSNVSKAMGNIIMVIAGDFSVSLPLSTASAAEDALADICSGKRGPQCQ